MITDYEKVEEDFSPSWEVEVLAHRTRFHRAGALKVLSAKPTHRRQGVQACPRIVRGSEQNG